MFGAYGQRMMIGGPVGVARGDGATARTAATPMDYGDCGPGAIPETALQGQVPRDDQDSGRSKRGYRCNLLPVGQNDIQNRGANFQLAWHEECAYVGIVGNQAAQGPTSPPQHPLEGIAVIDASTPSAPELVRIVQSPVGRTQHEALEVNERRGMLVVQIGGLSAQWIETYDVSGDCRNPVFKGRYDAGSAIYHGQKVSDDGMTVYASDTFGQGGRPVLDIIDVSDMTRPKLLKRWDPSEESPPGRHAIHDLELSADGNRAYLGAVAPSSAVGTIVAGPPSTRGGPSMVTLDTSDIQERRPNPDLRVVSSIELPNFGHTVQRARIGGRPYIFSSGEAPVVGADNCPWAWGHVLDMSDERNPVPVSEIKLEVNEQSNCPQTGQDDAVYSIHYVGVDDEENTTRIFYTYYTGGLRAFDVRDPANPKEIAYYHPPPKEETVLKPISPFFGDLHKPTWDSVTSNVRVRPRNGHLWAVSIANGFQILEGAGLDAGPGNCGRPLASITRSSLRASRRRFSVSGRASAFRCVRGRRAPGRVTGVQVYVARRTSGRCRFLSRRGRLGPARSCRRRSYLRARLGPRRAGKVPWTFRTRARLPRGSYVVGVRARDPQGSVSRSGGRYAVRRFTVE
jgi:hypothetical protein